MRLTRLIIIIALATLSISSVSRADDCKHGICAGHENGNDPWMPAPAVPNVDNVLMSETIECASEDMQQNFCNFDATRVVSVELIEQESNSACVEGASYSINAEYGLIEVDSGCRALFQITRQ